MRNSGGLSQGHSQGGGEEFGQLPSWLGAARSAEEVPSRGWAPGKVRPENRGPSSSRLAFTVAVHLLLLDSKGLSGSWKRRWGQGGRAQSTCFSFPS